MRPSVNAWSNSATNRCKWMKKSGDAPGRRVFCRPGSRVTRGTWSVRRRRNSRLRWSWNWRWTGSGAAPDVSAGPLRASGRSARGRLFLRWIRPVNRILTSRSIHQTLTIAINLELFDKRRERQINWKKLNKLGTDLWDGQHPLG